jgi:hypothetical protein
MCALSCFGKTSFDGSFSWHCAGLFAGGVENVGAGFVQFFVHRFVGQHERRAGADGLPHVIEKYGRNHQLLEQLSRLGGGRRFETAQELPLMKASGVGLSQRHVDTIAD